jgi:stearoyl-CoA desaturase (delta-9 desaturase)
MSESHLQSVAENLSEGFLMNEVWMAHDALVEWLTHGVLAASGWEIVIFALAATHITIAAVTI